MKFDFAMDLAADHYTGADQILLTTKRAESNYGVPVAVLVGGPNDGVALGPDDLVPHSIDDDRLPWLNERARQMVAAEAIRLRVGGSPAILSFLGL
jgi:hypothetical protein